MKPQWTPTKYDIEFVKELTQVSQDGALWHIPSTGQTYRLDTQRKTLALISGEVDQLHARQIIVFSHIGWTVTDEIHAHCWN